jgi:hypothetical protein
MGPVNSQVLLASPCDIKSCLVLDLEQNPYGRHIDQYCLCNLDRVPE